MEQSSIRQGNRTRKLRCGKIAHADAPNETRDATQSRIGVGYGRKQPNRLAKHLRYNPNRLDEIAVVGKYGGNLIGVLEGIEQKMARDIHIASLFLDLDHLHHVGPRAGQMDTRSEFRRIGETRELFRDQKSAHVHRELGDRGECVQIELLAAGRARIEPPGDAGRVILDADDLVGRAQQATAKRLEVEPLQGWPLFQPPEIDVETVDIDDRAHEKTSKKAKAASDRS